MMSLLKEEYVRKTKQNSITGRIDPAIDHEF